MTAQPIILLTLAIGEDYRKTLAPALASKKAYAEKRGYTYLLGQEEWWDRERPTAWSKIPFLLDTLEKSPEGCLVFLSDADVLITNPDLRLEDVVVSLLPEGKDMLIAIDACGHINSGNILLRNTAWTRDYFRRVYQQTDLLYHIWWENAAMIKLLEQNPTDLAKTQVTGQHKKFNAYLMGLPGQSLWTPGDLLVHFAGGWRAPVLRQLQSDILAGKVPRLGQTGEISYI
jgi:hypothetical protein